MCLLDLSATFGFLAVCGIWPHRVISEPLFPFLQQGRLGLRGKCRALKEIMGEEIL